MRNQSIGDTGYLWKKFADLESGELYRNGSEGPANLGGYIGLGGNEARMGRPTVEMKVDDPLWEEPTPATDSAHRRSAKVKTPTPSTPMLRKLRLWS